MRGRPRTLFVALLVLGLASGRAAASPSGRTTPQEAANEIVAAAGDEARIASLAARDDPDPWLVADRLLAAGRADLAVRFARAAPRVDVEALPAWCASHAEDTEGAKGRRAALDAARAHLGESRATEALEALGEVAPKPEDASGVEWLRTRGRALQELRRYQESAKDFAAARPAAETMGWLAGAASCAEQEARSHFRGSDMAASRGATLLWLALEEKLGTERGIGRARGMLALVESRRGAYAEAEILGTQAIDAADATGDAELAANTEITLGFVHYTQGDVAGATGHFERALARLDDVRPDAPVARFVPDMRLVLQQRVNVTINLSAFAFRRGDAARAFSLLDDAGRAADEAGNPRMRAPTLIMRATLLQASGRRVEALASYEAAVASFQEAGDRAGEATALRRLAALRGELGDHPGARVALERVLEVQQEVGEPLEVVKTRIALARSLEASGETTRAGEHLDLAFAAARKLDAVPVIGKSLLARGRLATRAGDYATALEVYGRNLKLQQAAGSAEGTAGALQALAGLDMRLDRMVEARTKLQQALAQIEKSGDAQLRTAILLSLAMLDTKVGDLESAVSIATRARDLSAASRNPAGQAAALGVMAAAERLRGNHAAALADSEASLALHAAIGDVLASAVARLNAALAKLELGRAEEALADLERALEDARASGEIDAVVQCQWALASVRYRRGEFGPAMAAAREAVDALAAIGRHLAEGEGAATRAVFAPVFEIGAEASLRAKDLDGLHHFLERGRAGTLLAALGGRDALRAIVVPEALREREARARAAEALALAQLQEARAAGALATLRKRRAELAEATSRLQDVVTANQREMRSEAGLVYPEACTLEALRAALAPGDAFVMYALLYDRAVALVATNEGARVVPLGTSDELQAVAWDLLREEAPYVNPEAADVARTRLLGALELPKGTRRLLVAPDGTLGYVPWTLLAPDLDIACLPSGSVFVHLAEEKREPGSRVLALGDPAYGTTARGGHRGGERGGTLARLPATRDEALAVGDVVLLGEETTEQRLRHLLETSPPWRAVHFACHGLIDVVQPSQSSLALTPDAENDGFLTALDVFGLQIPADLVVLSGCETGRGHVVNGEGILGLTRAFMVAGSPRVLCSLWKVDDEATRALMTKFYELWNPERPKGVDGAKGLTASAALRQAQAHVRSQKKWAHPTFWAAWVLWGLPD